MTGQRIVAEGIRHRARSAARSAWLLGPPVDQGGGRAWAVAGAVGASDAGGGRDQPAKRTRLDVELAGRGAGQLAGRIDTRPVMALSLDAI